MNAAAGLAAAAEAALRGDPEAGEAAAGGSRYRGRAR
jgi:hypothetical protein